MMNFRKTLLIFGVIAVGGILASPSYSSSIVIGEGLGASCYQEAKSRRSGRNAIEICDLALKNGILKRTDIASTYVNRGIVRSLSGDQEGAIADYNQALKINPELAEAFANRGAAYIRQTEYSKALAELDQALAMDLEQPGNVYFNRAILYEHFGNLSQAYLDYVKASELRPDWQLPKIELARFVVKSD